ncbi:MAG: tRNA guanosine(34) transglycosylase Tgt, partial [Patescibacteria group bacterium]
MSFFEKLHQDSNSNARTGLITTDHGDILTPAFMPVGTQATVKTLDSADLKNINSQIILGNTYHLHLQPGEEVIAKAGGLHKFMNWDRPILTDSGGFQVFSLGLQKAKKARPHPNLLLEGEGNEGQPSPQRRGQGEVSNSLVKITDDGVTFRSHRDGSLHTFTPEVAIEIQHKLGADIIMAFDECTPDDANPEYTREAMERTHTWARRCLEEHRRLQANPPLPRPSGELPYRRYMFGIIQGAISKDLREESAKYIASLDFDGIAIGGESIGYNMEATGDIIDWVRPHLPESKPRYAMGIGLNPTDLLIAVEHGIDMFDCVAPTRLARHGL